MPIFSNFTHKILSLIVSFEHVFSRWTAAALHEHGQGEGDVFEREILGGARSKKLRKMASNVCSAQLHFIYRFFCRAKMTDHVFRIRTLSYIHDIVSHA